MSLTDQLLELIKGNKTSSVNTYESNVLLFIVYHWGSYCRGYIIQQR